MKRRQKFLLLLVVAAILGALLGTLIAWAIPARADANWVRQGNVELLDPNGFWWPATELQVGRNAYENIIHGTAYTIPPFCGYEDVFNAMVKFHAQRWAWFAVVFGNRLYDSNTAEMVIVEALRYGMDYRISIPCLLFESTFGAGSPDFYGSGSSGSFAYQTHLYFERVAGYGFGNDPQSIFGHYNCWKWDTYIPNCMEVYRGCDGGDRQ